MKWWKVVLVIATLSGGVAGIGWMFWFLIWPAPLRWAGGDGLTHAEAVVTKKIMMTAYTSDRCGMKIKYTCTIPAHKVMEFQVGDRTLHGWILTPCFDRAVVGEHLKITFEQWPMHDEVFKIECAP